MTRMIDLQAVRAALRDVALAGFAATDDAVAARAARSKVGLIKPPPPTAAR